MVAPVGAAVPVVAPLLAGGLLGDVAGAAPAAHAEDPVPGPPLSEEPVEEVGVAQAWAEDAGAPEAWAEDAGVSAAQPEPVDEPAEAPALPAVPLPEDEPADGPQAGGWWTEAAGEPEAWAEDAGAPAAQPEPVDEPAEEPVVAPVPAPAEDLVPVEDPAAGGAGLWPDPAAAPVETGTALGTAGLASGLGAGALAAGAALVPGAVVDPAVDPAEEAAAPVAADADEAPAPGWGDEPAEPTDAAEPAALAETSDPLLPEPAAPPVNEPGPLGAAVPLAQPPAEAPVDPLSLRPAAPAQVVLALGANVGKVVPTLRTAVRALSSLEGLTVTAVAPLARTTAVTIPGTEPQPDYLNTVLLATTTMTPRELHEVCQDLEAAAGRVRTAPWGPRTLDIDLISFEGVTSDDPALTLPHPRAAERAFVLVPWSTADPFAELDGRSVAALAEAAPDRGGLRWLALDWLDSDRLPALPTGQYVVPPTDDQVPAPEGTPAPEPAPAPVAEAVPAPVLPAAEPVAPAPVPAPAEPVAPAAPAAAPVHQPEPAAPQAPAAPAEPVFSPGPAPEDDWAAPMGWDDVIGGNRS
ncbi:2-amino-4-hydroxy-6-hydroxymethyldihydropteridine diphosphokinase [Actinomyces sp. AC-20-1]|nr:2-amino-4-hydroxy-6-hydroxymethyldihydropteridine diphosphokinase [Actinomyces sp. AC-20-1]